MQSSNTNSYLVCALSAVMTTQFGWPTPTAHSVSLTCPGCEIQVSYSVHPECAPMRPQEAHGILRRRFRVVTFPVQQPNPKELFPRLDQQTNIDPLRRTGLD